MKISSTFKVRQIKPENICIGDTVRWTTKQGDMTVSNVGKVARKEHYPQFTQYETSEGMLIGTYWRDNLTKPRITLLQPAPQNADQPLESFDKLLDIAEEKSKLKT